MGSLCQKQDNIINWPCRGQPRQLSRRPTFTIIPEEESNILSQYEKSQFTASQFFVAIESQRVSVGRQVRGDKIQLLNIYNGRYLASHSIKYSNLHNCYEVSLQGGEGEQQACYNEWHIFGDKEELASGDTVDIKHHLSQRYLSATDDGSMVFCSSNSRSQWCIEFDTEQLVDGSFIEIKHKETELYLCSSTRKALMDHNRMVALSDPGKGTQWKVLIS